MTETNTPSNALNPNDFLSHFTDLLKATQAKDTGVAKLRAIRARFESMGANMRALDLMLKLRNMEPEDAQMLLRDTMRYSRWVHMKIGDQADLFEASDDAPMPNEAARGGLAEAEAYNEGHAAGMAGRSSTDHRYQPGSPMAQRFFEGWSDGQDVVAQTWGIPRDGTGLAIKPPKKEKAVKKGASAAPSGRPRGRPRKNAEGAAA
jgi:hypothetical protein